MKPINLDMVLKPILTGFTDSDWGTDKNDRKSIAGYGFYFGTCLISWNSKKQASVALSSCEAEYMALAHAAKEGLWLRALLKYLGLSQQTTPIYCDNTAAITVSKDPANHARVKHINMRYHFIRGVIETS